ncbi:MAG: hypothetical protein IIC84_00755 [Chloroflexi bacterium]|nr:hypothetical protein [Chloroflexota bacterium]
MTTILFPQDIEKENSALDVLREHLSEAHFQILLEITRINFSSAAPLMKIKSQSELNVILPRIAREIAVTADRLGQPLASVLPRNDQALDALVEITRISYRNIYQAAEDKVDLLGEDLHEQLLGALESAEGFDEWILNALRNTNSYRMTTIFPLIGTASLYSQALKLAIFSILLDVEDWELESYHF